MKTLILLTLAALAGCGGTDSDPVLQYAHGAVPATRDPSTVVMIGDSITYRWFTTAPQTMQTSLTLLNAGISGQTSEQIAARFEDDAVDSVASTVVILAGTNDMLKDETASPDYVEQMAMAGRDAGMRVVLCLIPPTLQGDSTAARVDAWNAEVRQFAQDNAFPLVDYYTPLAAAGAPGSTAILADGIHPTAAGYVIMWAALSPEL
jgi:acyl-CoA thioesterase I